MSERDLADRLARAALEVCPDCAAGRPRSDCHNGIPTDYHGYVYNPCKLPAGLREAIDLWRQARAPARPEILGTWQGVPFEVTRPDGMSDMDWADWKQNFTEMLG